MHVDHLLSRDDTILRMLKKQVIIERFSQSAQMIFLRIRKAKRRAGSTWWIMRLPKKVVDMDSIMILQASKKVAERISRNRAAYQEMGP